MTLFLPLKDAEPPSSLPPFLTTASDNDVQLAKVFKSVLKARRIVVVCGAGISVQAGIPDFRSSEGLFTSLKRDNPKENISSGKDLFDASVFNSEQSTLLFCQMISRLSELSKAAEPTSFHRLLRALDESGKLLRVYTQNIDALEVKSGLSFGLPEFDAKRSKPRSPRKTSDTFLQSHEMSDDQQASTSRLPSPTIDTPRCIPLHGTLQMMHCQVCTHSFPLEDHLPSLSAGILPECPECTSMETTRQLIGKRARGVGKLRPSVVLYNEAHKDGEGVGEVAQKDLIGSKGKGRSGADLLLVVGTSLRVPGTKRMVREFAKAVHARGSSSKDKDNMPSPSPTPRPEEDTRPKAIYLNLDFPVPTREWEGVFDVWLQGDAQKFGELLQDELEKTARAKELAEERRRRKDDFVDKLPADGPNTPSKPKKRKIGVDPLMSSPSKKHKPLTPPSTPKRAEPPPFLYHYYEDDGLPSQPSWSQFGRIIPEVIMTRRPPPDTRFMVGCAPPTPEQSPPRRPVQKIVGPYKSLLPQSISLATLLSTAQSEYYSRERLFDIASPAEQEQRLAVSFVRTQS